MKHSAPQPQRALAATLLFPLPALFLALGLTLALLRPCTVQAAGALPWLAPGQQDNASALGAHAPDANASGPASPPAAAQAGPAAAPAASLTASLTASPVASPVASLTDEAGKAQSEVLRQYFRRQLTLAEDFPEVFSRRVRNSETMAFTTMCEMQRRRGLLERFRAAEVDLSGLVFTRVTADPDLARIHVTGRYSFTLGPKALPLADLKPLSTGGPKAGSTVDNKTGADTDPAARARMESSVQETLEEDALFVLLPELGQWKIFERREGWRP